MRDRICESGLCRTSEGILIFTLLEFCDLKQVCLKERSPFFLIKTTMLDILHSCLFFLDLPSCCGEEEVAWWIEESRVWESDACLKWENLWNNFFLPPQSSEFSWSSVCSSSRCCCCFYEIKTFLMVLFPCDSFYSWSFGSRRKKGPLSRWRERHCRWTEDEEEEEEEEEASFA